MVFGKQLRKYRMLRKLTQPQLAKQLDVALRTLQNYEQCTREPSPQTIVRIADILDVTTDELLGRNIENDSLTYGCHFCYHYITSTG